MSRSNNVIFEGTWEKGILEGPVTVTIPGRKPKTVTFARGNQVISPGKSTVVAPNASSTVAAH